MTGKNNMPISGTKTVSLESSTGDIDHDRNKDDSSASSSPSSSGGESGSSSEADHDDDGNNDDDAGNNDDDDGNNDDDDGNNDDDDDSEEASKQSQFNGTKPSTSMESKSSGSSRLFQPHRSLGLLTAASPQDPLLRLPLTHPFQRQRGKFYLQLQASTSDETFVTIPLQERFQIVTVGKLVPVLVSRSLPPSARHHRRRCRRLSKARRERREKLSGGNGKNAAAAASWSHEGGDDEEMHRAISDASLSITVASHGPSLLGRAVSMTLYQRTRPVACLDAFPFLKSAPKSKQKQPLWSIVDMINLGKLRVDMHGEKEGKKENALLLAIICAREDEEEQQEEDIDEVQVLGNDSEDSSSEDETESVSSQSSSGDDDDSDSDMSLEDHEQTPPLECHGRILLVQATRTTLEIVKTIDLHGAKGSNFIPHTGLHPSTYVNKILLGGRPSNASFNASSNASSNNGTSLILVNVRSGKIIHSFQCLNDSKSSQHNQNKNKKSTASITTLEQSPAVDTIAVGLSDGSVHLINALHDVRLFSLSHKSRQRKETAVSSLSFRTDGNATRMGVAPLAVGCDDGTISIWDLTPVHEDGGTRRTLLTQIESAHRGGVSKLEFLPGEPLLLSTGLYSNSIVLHVFDAPDHSARVLRQRRGHTAPPRLLRYLHPGAGGGGILAGAADGTDASSCQILSCGGKGDRSLRIFSSARTNLDKEWSQGPGIERKAQKTGGRAEWLLPEITGMATCETRSRDWGDVVTIHRQHAMAYVWSSHRGAQSGPVLKQPHWNISAMKKRPPTRARATSVAISACGNFVLVGTLGGVVYKYNVQSGLPRGSFPRDAVEISEKEERRRERGLKMAGDVGRTMRILEKKFAKGEPSDVDRAERERGQYLEVEAKRKAMVQRASHEEAVVGIAIDSLNKTVVTAGADSKIVLWNFITHMPHKKSPLSLPSPATKLCHVRDSDLAAIAMMDFGVVIFDCSSLSIVRYFGGSRCRHLPENSRMSHTGPITDLGFGPDGRRLFTSSLDGTIRVWDVPTGLCVDWMAFSSPPTSLALSPTGEFLATSHVGHLGISLWCDKSFFRMVFLDGTPVEPAKMNEPCPVAECEEAPSNEIVSPAPKPTKETDTTTSGEESNKIPPPPKKEGLITLSGLPSGHWKNLFHLELVKERNKPKEAPKKPPQAPFFLQWRAGIGSGTNDPMKPMDAPENDGSKSKSMTDGWDAVWSEDEDDDVDDEDDKTKAKTDQSTSTRINSLATTNTTKRRKISHHRSRLADILLQCSENSSGYAEATSHLSGLGPSLIDVEISSLCYGIHDLEDGLPLLQMAATWLLEACESRQSFEAINAYLHRYLHVHANVVTQIDECLKINDSKTDDPSSMEGEEDSQRAKLKEFMNVIGQLREKQLLASNRLLGKMQHTLCLLRHFSRMV